MWVPVSSSTGLVKRLAYQKGRPHFISKRTLTGNENWLWQFSKIWGYVVKPSGQITSRAENTDVSPAHLQAEDSYLSHFVRPADQVTTVNLRKSVAMLQRINSLSYDTNYLSNFFFTAFLFADNCISSLNEYFKNICDRNETRNNSLLLWH